MGFVPGRGLVVAICALLVLIWGSTWFVIKDGLALLPPLTSAGARILIAGAVMLAIAPWLRRREGGTAPPAWLWMLFGFLQCGWSFGVIYWCERVLPSGLCSLLWSTFPLMVALGAHFFLPGERLRFVQGAGFVLAFAGIVFLFATDLRELSPRAVGLGLLLLTSPFGVCIGTMFVKRHGRGISSALLNRNAMLFGGGLLGLAATAAEWGAAATWNGHAWFTVLYLALVGTVLTFGLYFWLMRHVAAYRLSLIAFLTPMVAMAIGTWLGKEPFRWQTAVGAALILGGVASVLLLARRPTPLAAELPGRAVTPR